jgi:AmiR/NasT family two-component response regulator
MERERISADEAFELLRTASQRSNRKLRDLARGIYPPLLADDP